MELTDVLPLLYERFGAFQALWNLYITLAIGILGFVTAAQKATRPVAIRVILIVAFLVFAIINLTTLNRVLSERRILEELAESLAKPGLEMDLVEVSRVSGEVTYLNIYHSILDLVVASLVWFIPHHQSKDKSSKSS
ncbi:hypothetical protein C1752_12029 [Acaryochloris thomasi RCC1774]|uniref:DUF4149 domain-containing protein n=1 Tax=Acaryochloris thomasi RCC1774 TaxID=1764569 RepID=A0A2W1J8H2_9CYAN|nr:hypothetical protein [Acaryochloris thomasi]PZD70458.1 hypothetical protein C1752_12029 [Acaryochloris thomasi RCC1774]